MSQQDFETLLQEIIQEKLVSGVLSSPKIKEDGGVIKVSIRPLMIKLKKNYQLTEFYQHKVVHCNLSPTDCSIFIRKTLKDYKQGIFSLSDSYYHVMVSKQNKMNIVKKDIKNEVVSTSHNRLKNHILQEGVEIPFLVALGIMTKGGKVIAKQYDKFRQINRFVEMVKDVMDDLPKDRCLEIVDFGCGKGYLTFALYYYLHEIEKREVRMVGLDLKEDVVTSCQELSCRLKFDGLTFVMGDINSFERQGNVDLVISLHACNTATDAALEKAVRWNTTVILCVPCCQHELYTQVSCGQLDALLRHGILKERFAALATDAARAELLTIQGYEVQILEFIDMEHTPKNLLLRAIKGGSHHRREQAKERYQKFKGELNIFPSLEKRFL